MSRTVGMLAVPARRHRVTRKGRLDGRRPTCTACGSPLSDGIAVIGGKVRTDALICSGCDRVGVACVCAGASS